MLEFLTLEYIITNYRWFLVVFFLLPLSAFYDFFFAVRNAVMFMLRRSAPSLHNQRVKKVSESVTEWKNGTRTNQMCTARPGWQAMSLRAGKYKKTFKNINVDLCDILDIDTKNKTCTVEPMVTMGQITQSLVPLGWILPILPELDDLTIGTHICILFSLELN
jgi:delta24-sterol reductase